MGWRLVQTELKSKYLKEAMDWRLVQNELKSKCLKQGHGLAFTPK
jgi:hypothetical protein